MQEAIKIVFLGTPEFAVESLAMLVDSGLQIAAVVTAPDQPAGRGQQLRHSPVKEFALQNGLKVLQPVKLRDPEFISDLKALDADLFIVVAFRMLPEVVWQMPRLGTFNLHASLLPQYRGAAPINHAIINGETETGLTTFLLKQEIDTGDILFREKIAIGPDETAGELHDRMKVTGAGLVLKTAHALISGDYKVTDQSHLQRETTILKGAPKIYRDFCRIDWSGRSTEIFNKIRGLSPYPAAFTSLIPPEGEPVTVKIFRTGIGRDVPGTYPGQLTTDNRSYLHVATSDGTIKILELQQSGKKMMKTDEFLRGFRINSDWRMG
ncbi:MAG: methionyl-tRNA formyltransferase [Bacteroidales bacterium]|nr:methionyl-tRNA formyltransferase [Bacteroidales bacterium]